MRTTELQEGGAKTQTVIRLLQEEIAATNQEVLLLTLELEKRVAERTAELMRSNEALHKEIEERKRAEQEINRLNETLLRRAGLLEAANRELEAFSYSVSHDLRTPLRHIGGFAALLQENVSGILSDVDKRHLNKIMQAAAMMGTLIDALLNFSRMSRVKIYQTWVDPIELVKNIVAEFGPETEGRHIVWNLHQLPRVEADSTLLRQVFVNLISNAIKYTRLRDAAEIEIGFLDQSPKQMVYFVRDNGVGFDPQYASKLFGVFQRLHSSEQFEGTGIGLANVERIIRRHGGETWAEGKLDKGATFYFSLPIGYSIASN